MEWFTSVEVTRVWLQVRRTGWEDRWYWAVMSEDECDFEVGDVGNRGPPQVSLVTWSEWNRLKVFMSNLPENGGGSLILSMCMSTFAWPFVPSANSLAYATPASCFLAHSSPHRLFALFYSSAAGGSTSCLSPVLIDSLLLLMRDLMSCITGFCCCFMSLLGPPSVQSKEAVIGFFFLFLTGRTRSKEKAEYIYMLCILLYSQPVIFHN